MSDSSQEIDITNVEDANTLNSSNITVDENFNEPSDIDSDDEISATDNDITLDILDTTDNSNSSADATISSDISNINLDEFNQTSSSNDESLLNSISAQDINSEYQVLDNASESDNNLSNVELSSDENINMLTANFEEDETKEDHNFEEDETKEDHNLEEDETKINNSENSNNDNDTDGSNHEDNVNEDETKEESVTRNNVDFKVGYPMTLDAIRNNEISLNISEKDTDLLKSLLSSNHEISNAI